MLIFDSHVIMSYDYEKNQYQVFEMMIRKNEGCYKILQLFDISAEFIFPIWVRTSYLLVVGFIHGLKTKSIFDFFYNNSTDLQDCNWY